MLEKGRRGVELTAFGNDVLKKLRGGVMFLERLAPVTYLKGKELVRWKSLLEMVERIIRVSW